jgi:xylan 1,4-beta-xylosidase
VTILLWNYHDDDLPAPAADVQVQLEGVAAGRPTLTHYRVDAVHSNAYEAWKRMGSPEQPTSAQYRELERAGKLQMVETPKRVIVKGGRLEVALTLPRQAVSLLKIAY